MNIRDRQHLLTTTSNLLKLCRPPDLSNPERYLDFLYFLESAGNARTVVDQYFPNFLHKTPDPDMYASTVANKVIRHGFEVKIQTLTRFLPIVRSPSVEENLFQACMTLVQGPFDLEFILSEFKQTPTGLNKSRVEVLQTQLESMHQSGMIGDVLKGVIEKQIP